MKYLVVGNSHTNCIRVATVAKKQSNVDVVNIKEDRFNTTDLEQSNPDVVALSIAGNAHNVITLFEQPTPFTSGGMDLDDKDRVSIPTAQLKYFLYLRLKPLEKTTEKIHARFPDAKFVYICAPPPLVDTGKIAHFSNPFKDVVKYGYAPNALRMLVYNIQVENYANLAKANNVHFLLPPRQSLTDDGLLASDYSGRDPTHANAAYGELVLEQLFEWGGNLT